jgi:predicted nuclease of predicted toxin-antitoxin system
VTPLGYPLLADENIQPEVVSWLRQSRLDVRTVFDEGLASQSDQDILRHEYSGARVMLTHDSDFGPLAIHRGQPFVGIIYVRPGHRDASFTIGTLPRSKPARLTYILRSSSSRSVAPTRLGSEFASGRGRKLI